MSETVTKCAEYTELAKKLFDQRGVPEVHDAIAKCEAANVRVRAATAALSVISEFAQIAPEHQTAARLATESGLYAEPLFGGDDMREEICTSKKPRKWILAGTAFLIADATQNAARFFDACPWSAPKGFHEAVDLCLRACHADEDLAKALHDFEAAASQYADDSDSSEECDPRRPFEFWDAFEQLFAQTKLGRELKSRVVDAIRSTLHPYAALIDTEDLVEKRVYPLLNEHVAFRCFV